MEKSFLISINISAHKISIEFPEKINDLLIPPTLLDLEMSHTKRVEYDC